MRILILGANLVGRSLAEILGQEGHDIVVVDESRSLLSHLQEQMDVLTVAGRPSYPEVLVKAGIEEADIVIAVTENDEVNMVACQVAHALFKIKHKIARVSSPHYHIRDHLYGHAHFPIDVYINPERILSRAMRDLLKFSGAQEALSLIKQQLTILIVRADNAINEASFAPEHGCLYIQSHGRWVPISAQDVQEGMLVLLACLTDKVTGWLEVLCQDTKPSQHMIIMGAGPVTSHLIDRIGDDYHIKVIESSKVKACELASEHENALVFEGDPTDRWFLNVEGIGQTDTFMALSDDDEDNLIACLQAKSMGVNRTIALINHLGYTTGFAQDLIDIIISPQELIASQIISSIYHKHFIRTRSFSRGHAIVFEWKIISDSKWCGRQCGDIMQWAGMTVLAVYTGQEILLHNLNMVLEQGYVVILMVDKDLSVRYIDRLTK